ncbi:MAG: hypothetical protein AAB403_16010 [Planctomycetota bacterium]
MLAEVTILICKTAAERDHAIGFLMALNYSAADITVEEAGLINYDSKKFYDPADGRTDVAQGFVVKGVKAASASVLPGEGGSRPIKPVT